MKKRAEDTPTTASPECPKLASEEAYLGASKNSLRDSSVKGAVGPRLNTPLKYPGQGSRE